MSEEDGDDIESQLGPHHRAISEMLVNAIRLSSQRFVDDATKDLKMVREDIVVHSGYTERQRAILMEEIDQKKSNVLKYIEHALQHPNEMKRSYSTSV